MRYLTVLVISLALGVLAPEAALSHNSGYAFRERAVRAREAGLRFFFNRAFPDFGPHEVRCRGLDRTRLRTGGVGYRHIRCRIESMSVPDFIYHLDRRGRVVYTRAWS